MALSQWAAKLPVVMPPRTGAPKHVTFVYPYYEAPVFLQQQLAWWATYPEWLQARLSAIIVDDGSPTPAADVLQGKPRPFPIRLFRIDQNLRWNWIAARNIGLHYAPEGWCLVTDIDHVIPQSTAESVTERQHETGVIYGFSRIEHTGAKLSPHMNSWFLTREMFWRVGGYDETLSGHYGTDGEWRRRCAATAPLQILTDRLVRHEYQGDSSTSFDRTQDGSVQRLIAARGHDWAPKVLSFPHREVRL